MNEESNINVEDAALMIKLIDVVLTRGAIRGDEMIEVGNLRARLIGFVQEMKINYC